LVAGGSIAGGGSGTAAGGTVSSSNLDNNEAAALGATYNHDPVDEVARSVCSPMWSSILRRHALSYSSASDTGGIARRGVNLSGLLRVPARAMHGASP
jgi:hypothetical protein